MAITFTPASPSVQKDQVVFTITGLTANTQYSLHCSQPGGTDSSVGTVTKTTCEILFTSDGSGRATVLWNPQVKGAHPVNVDNELKSFQPGLGPSMNAVVLIGGAVVQSTTVTVG